MSFELKIKDISVSGIIIKCKRRGISIEVLTNGTLVIRSPKNLSKEYILRTINVNNDWIYEKVNLMNHKNSIFINRKYKTGELYLILGEYYQLDLIHSENDKKVIIDENNRKIKLYYDATKDVRYELLIFYKEFAFKYIRERVKVHMKYFDDVPKEIKIKEQKRKWGSCTYDNKLLFNWKIIMAPKKVIDYLVVHEMSHMKHKNHSRDFWNSVQSVICNYNESRKWLKENGFTLEL